MELLAWDKRPGSTTAHQALSLPFSISRQTSALVQRLHLADLGLCLAGAAEPANPIGASWPNFTAFRLPRAWSAMFSLLRLGRRNVSANSCQADKLASMQPCLSLEDFSMRLQVSAQNALQLEKPPGLGLVAMNMVWLTEMKDAALAPDPELTISGMHKVAEDAASFQLTCKRTAAMVALDTSVPGTFSENLLTCVPDEPMRIGFSGRTAFDLVDLVQTMTVTSLADTLTK